VSEAPTELRDQIPTFNEGRAAAVHGPVQWTGITSIQTAKSLFEVGTIVAVAAAVFFGLEEALRLSGTPSYVFPKPTAIVRALVTDFGSIYAPALWATLQVLLIGLGIGASVGLVLAAIITQKPFVEKIVAPYVLMLVTTPMIALVPFLTLELGLSNKPRVIAVALASGPMVMINSATGFRRTDLAKIALARSYGASTFQIFRKIRFPLALPMIIVGFMVGSIFALLTAVGSEMISAQEGLGYWIVNFGVFPTKSAEEWAAILMVALLGISIYVIFFLIGKRWASWEA
jgi:NitT/TauT family transport system permease protein